jgi:hypothetical protein
MEGNEEMLTVETIRKIKLAHGRDEKSIGQMVKDFNLSRNTVRRLLPGTIHALRHPARSSSKDFELTRRPHCATYRHVGIPPSRGAGRKKLKTAETRQTA